MLQLKSGRMDVARIRFSYILTMVSFAVALSVKVKTFEELSNMIAIYQAYTSEREPFSFHSLKFPSVKTVHTQKN